MASRLEDHSKQMVMIRYHFHRKNFPTVFLTDFFTHLLDPFFQHGLPVPFDDLEGRKQRGS
jgi:hypothetical protein